MILAINKNIYRILVKVIILSGLILFNGAIPRRLSDSSPIYPTSLSMEDSVFQIGEELTYNVSFLGIDLGQVKIKLLETATNNNQKSYKAVAYIDSYKGVPLVDLHAVYETIIEQGLYSGFFHARDKQDNKWISYLYHFDYPHKSIYLEQSTWKSGKIDKRDTLHVDTLSQDGLSLFFLARRNIHYQHPMNIPVIINEKKGNALINFTAERTKGKIDAVDYPIDLIYFDGEANFIGVFGLTGGFEGWFSNDAARIPVIAKMKVLIGKINIELMSWKRDKWMPPRYDGNNKN